MNPELDLLEPYPFERLRDLFADLEPPAKPALNLGIGEPQHAAPAFVLEVLASELSGLARYPATRGIQELRNAMAAWLAARFKLPGVDPEREILPVAGTREGLFAIAQAVVDRSRDPLVLCPNPFYQIYEGAALLAGADIHFLDCRAEGGFIPDYAAVSSDTWQRCQLLYLCNPGNPSGAITPLATLRQLVALAREHNFVIVSDECYSEIYDDEASPPPGLLEACVQAGAPGFDNCLVFHSLSKRSNLPGLRSGFVAGSAKLIASFLRYRTYQGCAMPLHHQLASRAAWSDEVHVRENRAQYREKFDAVCERLEGVLDLERPAAGFYLWPQTPLPDTELARRLYAEHHVTVLPGRYLGRDTAAGNPGENRVRMALVPPLADCLRAADCLRDTLAC
ncbi:MAG: succinyldiaminopimelate transaminase [Halieaceae bacterium]|jgi:N-succinyldiaminopimelate aminotransferase|nr:succinyldiaminopimelate transaminase [Halieaceae bacterium]